LGFHVSDMAGLNFANYFSASTAQADLIANSVYTLDNDNWEEIADPDTTMIERGKAYWVYSDAVSDFTGPITVAVDQGDGLDYGKILLRQDLEISNLADSSVTIDIQHISSLEPSGSGNPVVAGDVPLLYRSDPNSDWTGLPESVQLLAVGSSRLDLAVDRTDPKMHDAGLYQSVIQVTTDEGIRILVPASAENTSSSGQ